MRSSRSNAFWWPRTTAGSCARRAYRGAIQEEDERDGARRLLTAMAPRPEWAGRRFLALYTGVKLLPHGTDSPTALRVRNQAAALADKDPASRRAKIHGSPDTSDAAAVRAYAARQSDGALRAQATALAADIERLLAPQPLAEFARIQRARVRHRAGAAGRCARRAMCCTRRVGGGATLQRPACWPTCAKPAVAERRRTATARARLVGRTGSRAFRAAVELRTVPAKISRADQLALLAAADAIYGTGLINGRERAELRAVPSLVDRQDRA